MHYYANSLVISSEYWFKDSLVHIVSQILCHSFLWSIQLIFSALVFLSTPICHILTNFTEEVKLYCNKSITRHIFISLLQGNHSDNNDALVWYLSVSLFFSQPPYFTGLIFFQYSLFCSQMFTITFLLFLLCSCEMRYILSNFKWRINPFSSSRVFLLKYWMFFIQVQREMEENDVFSKIGYMLSKF
jgi:hypothetical protein